MEERIDLLIHEVLQGRLGHATALSRAVAKAARPCRRNANSCQLALLPSSFSMDGENAMTRDCVQFAPNPLHDMYG